MKTLNLAFLLALFVAQVAVTLPAAAQNPRLNRQQPAAGMEGGGHEQVEQPVRPNRQSMHDHRQAIQAQAGPSANRSVLQVQPGVYYQTAPGTASPVLPQMMGTPARKWPSLWDTCPDAFFQGKDRRIVQEMERNGQTVWLNSIDGPQFLPRGRFEIAGSPMSSNAFAFNLQRTDNACGLAWFEVVNTRPLQVRYQCCDQAGRPVGQPQLSSMVSTSEVHWPIPGYTGCASPGEGQVPVCNGPFVWFAVGNQLTVVGPDKFTFAISFGPKNIATTVTTWGEVFYSSFY